MAKLPFIRPLTKYDLIRDTFGAEGVIVAKGCVKSGQNIPCIVSELDIMNIPANVGI